MTLPPTSVPRHVDPLAGIDPAAVVHLSSFVVSHRMAVALEEAADAAAVAVAAPCPIP